MVRPMDLDLVEVDVDADGLSADRLSSILSNWHTDPSTKDKPFPKILYTMSVDVFLSLSSDRS